MQKFPRVWDNVTRASYLQRRIIVASIIYYQYDQNIIEDSIYNELATQLKEIQSKIDVSKTRYGYVFKDFTGSTGFDLFYKLKQEDQLYLDAIARNLVGMCSIEEIAQNYPQKKGRLI